MSPSGDDGKPAQSGLVDMGDISFYNDPAPNPAFTIADLANFTGSFSEMVLNVTWAQLQPSPGGPLNTSAIESAIAAVNAYNAQHGTDVGIKLRVWGGYTAPEWAKYIDGPPITIMGQASVDPNVFTNQTIGRFWTADYVAAWTGFQNTLAAAYDGNPVIRGISQTAGAAATDEPFVPLQSMAPLSPNPGAPTVNQTAALQAGGYTDAAQMLTLRGAIADYSQWSTTPLDFTMNRFHVYDSGNEMDDANFTLAVLQQARNSSRLVQPGNHALNNPLYAPDAFVYGQITADSALDPSTAPASYQTASPVKLPSYASVQATVANGVAANTGDIELWDFGGAVNFTVFSPVQVQALSTAVASGNAPVTGAPDDGSALGFVAPAFVTGAAGTVAFSGTDAVLLASATTENFYGVRLTSLNNFPLAVANVNGIVTGSTSGSVLTFTGSLSQVNTVLASLTDTLQSGTDVVQVEAWDSSGHIAVRNVGVQIAPPAASSTAGAPPASGIAGPLGSSGILLVGGVQSALAVAGNLEIGAGASTTLLAALAPTAYSTASLTIGGTFEVQSGGTAFFSGALGAAAIRIDSGGAIDATGTLTAAAGSSILNDGTIEAAANSALGLQRLTVANALAGAGTLLIDPGATLVLTGPVGPDQVIQFAPNSIAQLSNDSFSPSTLVLENPGALQAPILGFTFADTLVLDNTTATSVSYDGATLRVNALSFALTGVDLAGLDPVITVIGSGPNAQSAITFVPPAGIAPQVLVPPALRGAVGTAVVVPDVVLYAPLPASPASDTFDVTLTTQHGGKLSAKALNGNTAVIAGSDSTALHISGTRGAVEQALQTLTYEAADGQPSDTITVTAAYGALSGTPMGIAVDNDAVAGAFAWKVGSGSFGTPGNWTIGTTPPGGANAALFGAGSRVVSGDGAVGLLIDTGTTTLTGQVTAQGLGTAAVLVDGGGALTLAGGAVLTARQQATVGNTGQGLLVLMGGSLALTGTFTPTALIIGEKAGSTGTVLDLDLITAAGTVVVGSAGTGTLELLGMAASVSDGGAEVGQLAGGQGSVTVNGGEWMNAGLLTVGDLGNGSLLVDGPANGTTGQVTAFNATIGAQAGGQGAVTLAGGELLVADVEATSSTLVVGAAGIGSLAIESGSEAAVGVALGDITNNNGLLVVGGTPGGAGRIRIGGNSALLVYGNAVVGGAAGVGQVIVGESPDDTALFALLGTLAIGGTGQVGLAGANATLRASVYAIAPGAIISGAGTLSGDGGGNGTVALASIDNDGTIAASGGNLLVYGGVSGAGTLSVATGAVLTLQAAVGSGQTLAFSSNARVVLDDPHAFAGTITGFGRGDVLELANTAATGVSWANGILTVQTTFGSFQLEVAGNFPPNAFSVQSDGLGGSNVTAGGWGDVHMTTFDGLHYDLQSTGDFVAVRSTNGNPWQIQIRTAAVPGATSITTELAAQLGDARVTFAVGRDSAVYIDGVADTTLQNGGVQSFAGGSLARLSADTWRLSWNSGEQVTVSDHGLSLDWSVGLGANDGRGSVQGLLGTDSGWARDFQLPNGSYLQPPMNDGMLGSFADAWRVSPAASLFDDMSGPAMPATALPLVPQPFSAAMGAAALAGANLPTGLAATEAGAAHPDANSPSAGDFHAVSVPNAPFGAG